MYLEREALMPRAQVVESRMQAFREMCKRRGLRVTPQRTEVFREVARTNKHPDANYILRRVRRRMPNVSLDTVYRILYRLEDEGMISRVQVPGDRLRFDGNTDRHHHFVCSECGLVGDFESAAFDNLTAPGEAREFGLPKAVHVEVRGVCEACRGEGKE